MVRIISQIKLSTYNHLFKPEHLINWDNTKPELKKFIFINVILAITEHDYLSGELTCNKLIDDMAHKMGNIKDQTKIYVENLICSGYIYYSDRGMIIVDKIYDELQAIDKTLSIKSVEVNSSEEYYKKNLDQILETSYRILNTKQSRGIYPIQFKHELGSSIKEDENRVLDYYELKLIKEGWILQKRAGALLKPSKKLIKKFWPGRVGNG